MRIATVAFWVLAFPMVMRCVCVLELPAFTKAGDRVPATVVAVRRKGKIVPKDDRELRFQVLKGPAIVFTELPTREGAGVQYVIEVEIESGGSKVIQEVHLRDCPKQRASVIVSGMMSVGSAEAQSIYGKLIGCKISNRWWIHYATILERPGATDEAAINENGEFTLLGGGGKILITVMEGTEPIFSFARVVYRGRTNSLGEIDIRRACAQR